jgi:general stress protein CsbA
MTIKRTTWFQIFKYGVYTAVFFNVILFMNREFEAGAHRFSEGFTLENFMEAFTSTFDTAAWVILLLLFELETYIIPHEKMKGNLKWIFPLIRGGCYIVIVSSFIGYCNNYVWLQKFEKINIESICEVTGQSWMIELDEFKIITEKNCGQLSESDRFFKYEAKNIYTDDQLLKSTYGLAIVDILNSLAWILVVLVLEIDVWLQLKNKFVGRFFRMSKYMKNVLYSILLFAAIYWGIFGDFLEFWDAFLWIVAFVFIEMNLFDWKKETDKDVSVD